MKITGGFINMILVIISAFATHVVAYAQLSTELEPAHSLTSQQTLDASSKTTDLKYLFTLIQSKPKKAYQGANFSFPVYLDTPKYRIEQQTKLTVKFKVVQHVFVSINDRTFILPRLLNNTPSELPS
ncbi:MAG: hypothetical protein ACI9LM_003862 [Alteromonadaceae bacterium]